MGFTRGWGQPERGRVIGQDPAVNATYMGDYDQNVAQGLLSICLFSWSDNRAGNAFHANQPDTRFGAASTATTITDASVKHDTLAFDRRPGPEHRVHGQRERRQGNAEDAFLNVPSVPAWRSSETLRTAVRL